MSAYNVLVVPEEDTCPKCDSRILRKVQFRYGELWQHEYQIGEAIRWGQNDVGARGHTRVLLSAHPEPCPVCGYVTEERYELTVEHDSIVGVQRASIDSEFERFGHEPFLVIEE